MPPGLDHLFARLQRQPLDHRLEGAAADIDERLASHAAIDGQTWRLRAAAAGFLVAGGAFISASTASVVAAPTSPFTVWSQLAPSTLLGPFE